MYNESPRQHPQLHLIEKPWKASSLQLQYKTGELMIDPLTARELEILSHLANGLSDREIAEELFLSLNTVKWHNRQIYSKLGVGSRTQAAALASKEGLLKTRPSSQSVSIPSRRSNLPAMVTSFVGRVEEIEDVKRLMGTSRLMTLTGPGGVGKSRLAIQIATQLVDAGVFQDGIYFVNLAPIRVAASVGDAIVKALGVPTVAREPIPRFLENYLVDKKLLLLLDNFEHLVEAAPLVGDLLSAAADVSALVTSREALRLYGETEYPVHPLALPELSEEAGPLTYADHEAVALFTQRAQAVKPDFSLTDETAHSVAEICVRLDGLPLAIELAAARVKVFSPKALLGQLGSRFTALKEGPRGLPERQRTLWGAIDWSYQLLDEVEKAFLARLAVFQGGRTIEAVEEVCCRDLSLDVLDGLTSLLNKNLLRQEDGPQGEPRFFMLETIHEYARERLQESGEKDDVHRRHAEYFVAWAELVRPDTRGGPAQLRSLHQMESEGENFHVALEWSLGGGDIVLGLRLVGALGHFWWRQGHYAEGQRWARAALKLGDRDGLGAPVRASLLDTAGLVAHFSHDRERGKRLHSEALALYEELGNKREMGWVLIYLAAQSFGQPDNYEEAIGQAEQGLSLLRRIEDDAGVTQALHVLGELARLNGNYEQATKVLKEGLTLARDLGDTIREAFILDSLGYLSLYDDDPQTAGRLAQDSLRLALEVGYLPHIPACLAGLAAVHMAEGKMQHAARLLGAADAIFYSHGFGPRPSDMPDVERTRAVLRGQLGDETFDHACAEGRAMNLEDAIAYALEDDASS